MKRSVIKHCETTELRAGIWVTDSVTRLGPEIVGQVLIAGSHGGVYAAHLAACARVRGVILNDAGIGLSQAGIGGLAYLEDIGIPGAVVDFRSAKIGDGNDIAQRGMISFVNVMAHSLGCVAGQNALACAERMRAAPMSSCASVAAEESRHAVRLKAGRFRVLALDSASLVIPEDAEQIIITGSHGGLLGGRGETALSVNSYAAFYNDAGIGCDEAGISRLPELDARGIIAGTVSHWTARIGDGRSSWRTGVLSSVNRAAEKAGAKPGLPLRDFIRELVF